MDPAFRQDALKPVGLPRTRGDGPAPRERSAASSAASPHTRGWTRGVEGPDVRRRGFPAHAGMDPRHAGFENRRPWASPHTRGWTLGPLLLGGPAVGFPAHAGMDPRRSTRTSARRRLPRTRGDGPRCGAGDQVLGVASPHTRGWTRDLVGGRRDGAGFPAHAGMDPPRGAPCRACSRLPRTRGDGPSASNESSESGSASPHTRGWTAGRQAALQGHGGFPAHAGMDPSPATSRPAGRRLPRTRGDGPLSSDSASSLASASPHTRGWTLGGLFGRPERSGFPAHAGMDPRVHPAAHSLTWLPRTRGDGPQLARRGGPIRRASPHTRGWTRPGGADRSVRRGFPAHAGMDPRASARSCRSARLPRTRGDGPVSAVA